VSIRDAPDERRPEHRRNRAQDFAMIERGADHLTPHRPQQVGLQRWGDRLSAGEYHPNLRRYRVRPQVLQELPAVAASPPPEIEDDECWLGTLDERVCVEHIVRAASEGAVACGGEQIVHRGGEGSVVVEDRDHRGRHIARQPSSRPRRSAAWLNCSTAIPWSERSVAPMLHCVTSFAAVDAASIDTIREAILLLGKG
jgi:hypothetical protein